MNNEYTKPEVIEVGKAQEVILGPKEDNQIDDQFVLTGSLDIDE